MKYDRGDRATAGCLGAHFVGVVADEVVRYNRPRLTAPNFVMDQTPGVTRSLVLDADGNSLSSGPLDLEIALAQRDE